MKYLMSTNNGSFFWKFRGLIVTELVRAGHEVHIVCPYFINNIKTRGVYFHYVEMSPRSLNPLGILSFWNATRAISMAIKPDVLIAFGLKNSITSLFINVCKKVSFLTGFGNLYVSGGWKKLLFLVCIQIIQFKFCQVWVLNRADYEVLTGFYKKNEKVHLIPGEGFDFADYPMRVTNSRCEFDFIYIGRLVEDKGARRFLRVGMEIVKFKPDARIRIFGPEDPAFESKLSIEEKNFFDKIYGGELGHSASVLQRSKFLILPSLREGLSRVSMEAMATGCIVVGSAVPGIEDLIQPGYSGFLFRLSDDDNQVVDFLLQIHEISDADLNNVRQNAHRFLVTNFNTKEVLSHYLKLIGD